MHRWRKSDQTTYTKELTLGFSLVGNNKAVINSKIDKLINLADDLGLAEIIDTEMEIIHI